MDNLQLISDLANIYLRLCRISQKCVQDCKKMTFRNAKMTGSGKIGVAKDGMVHNLHYISNAAAAERLSCPVNHSLACFYRYAKKRGRSACLEI